MVVLFLDYVDVNSKYVKILVIYILVIDSEVIPIKSIATSVVIMNFKFVIDLFIGKNMSKYKIRMRAI